MDKRKFNKKNFTKINQFPFNLQIGLESLMKQLQLIKQKKKKLQHTHTHKTLTVFSFGEAPAPLGAAGADVVWGDEEGTALQLDADVTAEILQLPDAATHFHHSLVAFTLVPAHTTFKGIFFLYLTQLKFSRHAVFFCHICNISLLINKRAQCCSKIY
jgi:hypothetical protein